MVSAAYDEGAILAQWQVPVLPGDSAAQLAARVLQVEHNMYARVIVAHAAGNITAANPLVIKEDEDGLTILDRLASG
jgi:folate-dependent phosphoribosylglycinamide formyltransferase PurN